MFVTIEEPLLFAPCGLVLTCLKQLKSTVSCSNNVPCNILYECCNLNLPAHLNAE